MKLSEISIRRPVLCAMASLGLILMGLVYLPRLAVREFPDVTPTVIKVTTVYPGAGAGIIETQITDPLEEALNSIEGIRKISSQNRQQVSIITVEFEPSRNIETAAQDVRDRVASVRGDLPEKIQGPTIEKQGADVQPMLWIALYSDSFSTLDLTSIAEKTLKDPLESLPGVSAVVFGGEKRFAIRLWLDSGEMAAKGVTISDIEEALRSQNVELPSGNIQGTQREFSIQTQGQLKTPRQYNDLVVKQAGGKAVYLRDVGHAQVGVEDEHSIARYNSKPCVGLGIVKQSKANTIAVAEAVKKELRRLKKRLPAGVKVSVPYDESTYVESSINEVWVTLGLSIVLVVLTIFFFLNNVRLTVIPSIAIPVCLIATFAILYWMGYSINIVTMLAFVLAIGLVVDDSIIVLENIYRHVQQGMKPLGAAVLGMKEIGFAVISTTLVLAVIFLPLAFQTSTTGMVFIEFAVVIACSVLISGFVALTLSPMLSAHFLRSGEKSSRHWINAWFDRIYFRLRTSYKDLLRRSLKRPLFIIVIGLGVIALSVLLYFNLEHEFLPDEDKGRFLCIAVAPEGSSCAYTDRMVKKMEGMIRKIPEVQGYFTAVALPIDGPGVCSQGLSYVRLKEQRKRNLGDILLGKKGLALKLYQDIEGAIVFPLTPQAIGDSLAQPFQLVLENEDLNRLNTYAQRISGQLSAAGFLEDVRSEFQLNKPQVDLTINRERAAALGVSAETIARTLQVLFGGMDVSTVNLSGRQYKVIAQLEKRDRLSPMDLDRIYVPNDQGQLIPLSNVTNYKITAGPNVITHYNRMRSAIIEGSPLNVTLGTAIQKAQQLIKKDLPPDFRYEWAGESRELIQSNREMMFTLCFALLIVYMVLASQFENLIDPFIIILTVPLAVFGAFGFLWVFNFYGIPGMSINLFSEIGLILLVGLVTKNGILLVEFANQLVAKGKNVPEAIYRSALIRFRPIMMTVTATIAGAMPIAIGFGMGGAGRRPLGIAVIGGMITSTFLTLFVIPTLYILLGRFKSKLSPPAIPGAKILVLVCCVLITANGCLMGPKYHRPQVTMPVKWKTTDASWKKANPQDTLPKGPWWKIFHDPVLDHLEDQAKLHNQGLKAAFESVNQARAAAGLSQANLVPYLELDPGYTNLDTIQNKFFGRANNIEGFYSIPLEFSYELDLWGRVRRSIEAAQDQAQASEADFQSVLLALTSEVARDYFLLRELKNEENLLKKIVQVDKKGMTITEEQYKAGIIKSFDVRRQTIGFKSAQLAVIDVVSKENELLNALAILCGKPPVDFDLSVGPLTASPPFIPPGMPSGLLERRPDIAEAERQMAAANAMIGEAKASFFPVVTLLGSVGTASVKLRSLFDWRSRFSSFGPDITFPLNYQVYKSAYNGVLAKYDQAVANYRQKVLDAFHEVEDALVKIHLNNQQQDLEGRIMEAAKGDLAVSNKSYQQGVINYLGVLEAQRLALEAELKYSEIKNAKFIWTIQLIKALGGGWNHYKQSSTEVSG
ncbi:MAG: efflux transporter outer membrane subunit [Candidatus Omnitrophica bacterium]|nr:efflux transporter outer membrane subunit [Candidatus Omnitrophota bacterium]MDE2009234.1 efflux transporter outer membrane subunit [Candidatus Omnitrophota bacterium]MDE2213754.1 efflux transporter outer membrane subunit [Candidatus Omnitrophota bacterium]MDE2230670.1 efflux transporter outer membrane subunit [Candidatus Omnitrophota bacterium]